MWGDTGSWLWGEGWGDSCQGHCAESLSHTTDALFLRLSTPLHMAPAWGNAIASPSELPVIPPCRAQALLRSQLLGPGCWALARLGVSVTEGYGFGVGAIPSSFSWTKLVPPLHGTSSSSTHWAPGGPILSTPGGSTVPVSGENLGQTELCGSGTSSLLSLFPKPDWCLLFRGDPMVPPSWLTVALPCWA